MRSPTLCYLLLGLIKMLILSVVWMLSKVIWRIFHYQSSTLLLLYFADTDLRIICKWCLMIPLGVLPFWLKFCFLQMLLNIALLSGFRQSRVQSSSVCHTVCLSIWLIDRTCSSKGDCKITPHIYWDGPLHILSPCSPHNGSFDLAAGSFNITVLSALCNGIVPTPPSFTDTTACAFIIQYLIRLYYYYKLIEFFSNTVWLSVCPNDCVTFSARHYAVFNAPARPLLSDLC